MNLWMGAAAVWFVFMTWLSHQTGEETGRVSRTLAKDLHPLCRREDPEQRNALLRKAAHVVVFAVLAALGTLAVQCAGAPRFLPVWYGAVAVWCWADEATKRFVPGRHFSWLDVGLNLLGSCIGAALLWGL